MTELRDCLNEGERIFAKGHLVKEDELAYARMNNRFHAAIVHGAGDPLLVELLARVHAVPFVAPGVVAGLILSMGILLVLAWAVNPWLVAGLVVRFHGGPQLPVGGARAGHGGGKGDVGHELTRPEDVFPVGRVIGKQVEPGDRHLPLTGGMRLPPGLG